MHNEQLNALSLYHAGQSADRAMAEMESAVAYAQRADHRIYCLEAENQRLWQAVSELLDLLSASERTLDALLVDEPVSAPVRQAAQTKLQALRLTVARLRTRQPGDGDAPDQSADDTAVVPAAPDAPLPDDLDLWERGHAEAPEG